MDTTHLLHLLPTLEMIAEAIRDAGWECQISVRDSGQRYRSIRLFHNQPRLQPDVLYLLKPTESAFPTDEYAYICAGSISGQANYIWCPGHPDEQILDLVLELLADFQEWEQLIDQLTYRNSGLQELCQLGQRLFGNPVCIHDDWFMMVAASSELEQVLAPEYAANSSVGFIPRMILDDFRHDSDYLETYSHRSAQIWPAANGLPASLYVNLWDGAVYQGRLLVIQHRQPFRQRDFLLAEILTQRAMFLLHRKRLGEQQPYRSMDDVVYSLIQGSQPEPSELSQLLGMLNWRKNDRFLCVRVRSQQPDIRTATEHVLHSELFRIFREGYIMFTGREQCLILNLSREPQSTAQIRHRLAPICRDYCLYAGISSPVSDIRDLHLAYYQAEVGLSQAFRLRSEKWIISFADCAVEHILEKLSSPLPPLSLVSPELLTLLEHDRQTGNQYFQTLRVYLLCERDIPKTAQQLIIHRTTLLYRLKKIQALTDLDLEDPWKRMYLILSLWILEKEGVKE